VLRLDSLVLEEQPLRELPADATRSAMLTGIREMGLDVLPWTRDARDLQARMEFARIESEGHPARRDAAADDALGERSPSDWPAVHDRALAASLETWLAPWLDGVTRRDHLSRLSLTD